MVTQPVARTEPREKVNWTARTVTSDEAAPAAEDTGTNIEHQTRFHLIARATNDDPDTTGFVLDFYYRSAADGALWTRDPSGTQTVSVTTGIEDGLVLTVENPGAKEVYVRCHTITGNLNKSVRIETGVPGSF